MKELDKIRSYVIARSASLNGSAALISPHIHDYSPQLTRPSMPPKGGNAKKESGRAKKAENEAKKNAAAEAERVCVAVTSPTSSVDSVPDTPGAQGSREMVTRIQGRKGKG